MANNVRVNIDTDGGTIAPDLAKDDIVVSQEFDGRNVIRSEGIVNYVDATGVDIIGSSGDFLQAKSITRFGNLTDTDRQSFIFLDAEGPDSPQMVMRAGVDSIAKISDVSTLKVLIGKLDNVVSSQFGQLYGHGFYLNGANNTGVYASDMGELQVRGQITVLPGGNAVTDTELQGVENIALSAQTDALQAISDAADAQSTADGKIVTFFQTTPPTAESEGDLWFDTDDGNKQYRWNGTIWELSADSDIAQAIADAAGAQATADGKVTTFYQPTQPTAEGIGDLWVDTDDGNKLYRWNGSIWEVAADIARETTTKLETLATITNNEIKIVNTVDADQYVRMFYFTNTNFGFEGTDTTGNKVLQLGYVNQISGWQFTNNRLYNNNLYIVSNGASSFNGTNRLLIGNYTGNTNPHVKIIGNSTSDYVQMYWNSTTDWGIKGNTASNGTIFQLGYINEISGFDFNNNRLRSSNQRLHMSNQYNRFAVTKLATDNPSSGARVQMYYSSDTSWGLYGTSDGTTPIFQLGSTNKIAAFNFDDTALYSTYFRADADGISLFTQQGTSVADSRIGFFSIGNATERASIKFVDYSTGTVDRFEIDTDSRLLLRADNFFGISSGDELFMSSTDDATLSSSQSVNLQGFGQGIKMLSEMIVTEGTIIERDLETGQPLIGSPSASSPTELDVSNRTSFILNNSSTTRKYFTTTNEVAGSLIYVFNRHDGGNVSFRKTLDSGGSDGLGYYDMAGGTAYIMMWVEDDFYEPTITGGRWVIYSKYDQTW